ncbi:hypothetical protein AAFF_G00385380 [Aldrovandia affinis]|uniref:Uncharacterized protein n=1 Tax=Aldrovandia affinis TaxID=143900 RepID=A0AAD7WLI6_9TELE|nr:hypothetical protein AAFF_G00385380 [Aldrovandia affinis]
MVQLESTKCSFLFCLGLCVLICSAIYLKARFTGDPVPQQSQAGPSPSLGRGAAACSRLRGDERLSREEEGYPLAFIVTIHKELEMFTRLLRAIYAPQNVYCVHVGAKSPPVQGRRGGLAGCFPNVFLASASER